MPVSPPRSPLARLAATVTATVADALGRVVAPKTLSERQTDGANVAHLHRTWGGHPVNGLTPARLTSMLEAADSGDLSRQSELFLDMRDRDPHLDAEMGKRERAILTLPWTVEPPRNPSAKEKRTAAAVGELIASIPDLEDCFLGMMDAAGHGFACLELTWTKPGDGERRPQRIDHRPQSWFLLEPIQRTELRLHDHTPAGAALWPWGWIQHRHAARAGYLFRAGLYRVLAWPWIMRQFSLRDLAEFLEIYGLPMRLGYYRPGADAAEKATLYRAVRDLGRHAGGIMPEGMRIDLLNAATGAPDPFMAMVEHCEAVMSRAILGGSLSSTPAATGLGSGVADLQGEVKRDLLLSDARQVQATLSRDLVYPIAALNALLPDPARPPVLRFATQEPADLTAFSDSLLKLSQAGAGACVPLRWINEQGGIPLPEEDEPTLAAAPPPSSPTGTPAPAATAAAASAPPAIPAPWGQALIDGELAQDRSALQQAAMERLLQPILAALQDGLTPVECLARIDDWYGAMDDSLVQELLTRGLAAAAAIGRLEVQRDPA